MWQIITLISCIVVAVVIVAVIASLTGGGFFATAFTIIALAFMGAVKRS